MVRSALLAASWAALLLPSCSASLYSKNSPVLQLDEKKYRSEIVNSNYTSIVEFYAPWCGHCKNLQPAYESAARNLDGLAKVAAVNCDEEHNKRFCGKMQVQGFPTLKIVRPGKAPGKPFIDDYTGQRNAKGIIGAVKDKIKNHVKRLEDSSIDGWLEADKDKPKAILFSEKSIPTALLKSLAIDFLGSISIGQVRSKDMSLCEKFSVTTFPSLVLLPGSDAEPVHYTGKLEKKLLVEFLSQAAAPNKDATALRLPAKASDKPAKKSSPKPSEPVAEKAEQKRPEPKAPETLPTLDSDAALRETCLTRTSSTCILFFNPATGGASTASDAALASLTSIRSRLGDRGMAFYNVVSVPETRSALSVGEDFAVVAINAKKGWIKRSSGDVDGWIDALRMGEGAKEALPEGLVTGAKAEKPPIVVEQGSDDMPQIIIEEITDEQEKAHDEL